MIALHSPLIYTFTQSEVLQNHAIIMESDKIEGILPLNQLPNIPLRKFDGILCPAFINAHCHLELSHLYKSIPTGTGLMDFISRVISLRDFPMEEILSAMQDADRKMWNNGIQAVGDISNQIDSISVKANSKIFYHTFVEIFDLLQGGIEAEKAWSNGKNVQNAFIDKGLSSSIVPHAPYSVSQDLFSILKKNRSRDVSISMHNQETRAEDELFYNKEGALLEFYRTLNLPINHFESKQMSSLRSVVSDISHTDPTILVHNTLTSLSDMQWAEKTLNKVFWCTCPNANLYIENTLPNYALWIEHASNIVIGTDSLSSNWSLSILDELKCIKKYQSSISTSDLLQWACISGSKAMGLQDQFGSLRVGTRPGIIHINAIDKGEISSNSEVTRIY